MTIMAFWEINPYLEQFRGDSPYFLLVALRFQFSSFKSILSLFSHLETEVPFLLLRRSNKSSKTSQEDNF